MFTEIFFATRVIGYLAKQVLWAIVIVFGAVALAWQGLYYWPLITLIVMGFTCWALGRCITWLIRRCEKPQKSLDEMCAEMREDYEKVHGYSRKAPEPVAVRPSVPKALTLLEVVNLSAERKAR